jgi:hypothetical protein
MEGYTQPMSDGKIQSEYKRADLRSILTALGDIAYQQACWVERRCPPGSEYDNVHIAFSFLLDDTTFLDNPTSETGVSVYTGEEASAIQPVSKMLYVIVTKYGDRHQDEYYINLPEWKDVVKYSKIAIKEVLLSDARHRQ